MEPLDERLANLGRAVAEANGPDHDAIADARRRWARSSRGLRSRRWAFVVAPALAVAAAIVVIVVMRTPDEHRALTYTVGDVPGERGQWIAAREPVQLRFSDGSSIEVKRDAKVRVAATDSRGSTLDVEQGALHAAVVHSDVSSWRFRTGPYTVLVKGTRFDAAWDSTNERFTLDMLEGKVEVMGPLIPAPVTVSAGQSVLANVREKRFEIRAVRTADATSVDGASESNIDSPSPPAAPASASNDQVAQPRTANEAGTSSHTAVTQPTPPVAAQTQSTRKKVAQPSATPPPSSAITTQQERPQPEQQSTTSANGTATASTVKTEKWRQYLAARAYSSAIAAAEQRGFDAVVAEATVAELYALADAARYAGRLARARDALIAARARSEQGKTAFLLGRISADQGDAAAAIEWFDRYLQEQPGGPLAETATGRLIELYKPRDAGRARKLAERYLAAYPDGSYAALAKTLVDK